MFTTNSMFSMASIHNSLEFTTAWFDGFKFFDSFDRLTGLTDLSFDGFTDLTDLFDSLTGLTDLSFDVHTGLSDLDTSIASMDAI